MDGIESNGSGLDWIGLDGPLSRAQIEVSESRRFGYYSTEVIVNSCGSKTWTDPDNVLYTGNIHMSGALAVASRRVASPSHQY